MGVFAIFRRKPKAAAPAAEDASPAEATATAPTEDTAATSGAEQEAAGSAAVGEQVREDEAAFTAKGETSGEGVEIPKQQSARKAADSESAEGARK